MALDFKNIAKLNWYYQALITASVCGGLLALFWYQYLTPVRAAIDGKITRVNELQTVVARSEAQEKQLARIRQDTIELQKKLDVLKAALPLEKETDEIFRAVQKQAQASGLKVSRVAPRPTVDHEFYTDYPLELNVSGSYHSIGLFLDRIRQVPRIVNISGLRLQRQSGRDASSLSVNATYTATTFVYKDDSPAPSSPAAKP